ncbi:hypothetical protein LX36DRAFT_21624 [Colletotrichum falcatum]|nr:hypothetical protein LX36DRAFT_21624 [Colletotrichum falcatum]
MCRLRLMSRSFLLSTATCSHLRVVLLCFLRPCGPHSYLCLEIMPKPTNQSGTTSQSSIGLWGNVPRAAAPPYSHTAIPVLDRDHTLFFPFFHDGCTLFRVVRITRFRLGFHFLPLPHLVHPLQLHGRVCSSRQCSRNAPPPCTALITTLSVLVHDAATRLVILGKGFLDHSRFLWVLMLSCRHPRNSLIFFSSEPSLPFPSLLLLARTPPPPCTLTQC